MYDVTIKWTQSKCTSLQIKNEAVTSMFSSTILYSIDVKKKRKKSLKDNSFLWHKISGSGIQFVVKYSLSNTLSDKKLCSFDGFT